jgi:hypothetical protein
VVEASSSGAGLGERVHGPVVPLRRIALRASFRICWWRGRRRCCRGRVCGRWRSGRRRSGCGTSPRFCPTFFRQGAPIHWISASSMVRDWAAPFGLISVAVTSVQLLFRSVVQKARALYLPFDAPLGAGFAAGTLSWPRWLCRSAAPPRGFPAGLFGSHQPSPLSLGPSGGGDPVIWGRSSSRRWSRRRRVAPANCCPFFYRSTLSRWRILRPSSDHGSPSSSVSVVSSASRIRIQRI